MLNILNKIPSPVLPVILMILLSSEFLLTFFIFPQGSIEELRILGWFVWFMGAMCGIIPIWELNKYGNTQKGLGLFETNSMVKTGIYSYVRHPQYLASILLHVTLILISQNTMIILIGLTATLLTFLETIKEDQSSVQKFGKKYEKYMREVPRLNILWGFLKRL